MPNEPALPALNEDEQAVLRAVREVIEGNKEPTLERVTTSIFGEHVAAASSAMLMPGEEEPTRTDQRNYCREHLIALNAKGCVEASVGADAFPVDAPFTLTPLGREWLNPTETRYLFHRASAAAKPATS